MNLHFVEDCSSSKNESGMMPQSTRKSSRGLFTGRKGYPVILPTLISLYLAGAGLIFLVCARTFLAFHIYLLSPSFSFHASQFSADEGLELNVPRQADSLKLLALDRRSLREQGEELLRQLDNGGEKLEITQAGVGDDSGNPPPDKDEDYSVDDSDVKRKKETGEVEEYVREGDRTSKRKEDQETQKSPVSWNGELEGLDLRTKLQLMSERQRREWLKNNWLNFQILRSDALSDQFARRMQRFLSWHHDSIDRGAYFHVKEGSGVVLELLATSKLPQVSPDVHDINASMVEVAVGASSDHGPQLVAGPTVAEDAPKASLCSQDNVQREDEEENCLRNGSIADAASNNLQVHKENTDCGQRFFMTWISPVSTFGLRERLCLESVFKWHPSACVVILSRSLDSEDGKKIFEPFLHRGYRLMAVTPDLPYLFNDTPADRWWRELRMGSRDPGDINFSQNLSNIMRLLVLYKYGGVYLDSDIIVLKNLSRLSNAVGAQSSDLRTGKWSRLNNAVLIFDRKAPSVYSFIEEFTRTFNGSKWGHNGPYLVTRVVRRIKRKQGNAVAVLPPRAFYPVNWVHIASLFQAPRDHAESRWQVLRTRLHSW